VLGTFCLAFAALLAINIAWLLWGTGLFVTAHAQHHLRAEILERIQHPRVTLTSAPKTEPITFPIPHDGDPVGILKIPRLHLDIVVVQGTSIEDLKLGPGHYPGTAFPWEDRGRVAIAGHRTTYLRPFWSLDSMRQGDRIQIRTEYGVFNYRVTGLRVVRPDALWVANQTRAPTLVLTTCNPRFSASQRLALFAVRL
jgi:LPXTG-site transpeptidase (sortase) family protein